MTATNIFYNFVGFRYSPPIYGNPLNYLLSERERAAGHAINCVFTLPRLKISAPSRQNICIQSLVLEHVDELSRFVS